MLLVGLTWHHHATGQPHSLAWSWQAPGGIGQHVYRVATNGSTGMAIAEGNAVVSFTAAELPMASPLQLSVNGVWTDIAFGTEFWICGKEGRVLHGSPIPDVEVQQSFDGDLGPMACRGDLTCIVSSAKAIYVNDGRTGSQWLRHSVPVVSAIGAVDISPSGWIVAAESKDRVLISTDVGASWAEVDLGISDKINCIAITANNVIVVGTQSRGILRSDDGGASWTYPSIPFVNRVTALRALSPSTIHAFCGYQGYTLTSTDAGLSFALTDSSGLETLDLSCAAGSCIAVGLDGLIVKISDAGTVIASSSRSNSSVASITFAASHSGERTGYAVCRDGSFMRRLPGMQFFERLPGPDVAREPWLVSSKEPTTVYISEAVNRTSWVSRDSGMSWTPLIVSQGPSTVPLGRVVAQDANVAYSAFASKLYRTTDAGRTWELMSTLPSEIDGQRAAFDVVDHVVWIADRVQDANTIFIGSDGGTSWKTLNVGGNGGAPHTLKLHTPLHAITITDAFISITTDGGLTWHKSPGASQRDSYVDVSSTGRWIRWDGRYRAHVYDSYTRQWTPYSQPFQREAVHGSPSSVAWDGSDSFVVPFGNGGLLRATFSGATSVSEMWLEQGLMDEYALTGCFTGTIKSPRGVQPTESMTLIDLQGCVIGEVSMHYDDSVGYVHDCPNVSPGVYILHSPSSRGVVTKSVR
jgi:photosystem II stability/assembly factor-like uncharacterized protein